MGVNSKLAIWHQGGCKFKIYIMPAIYLLTVYCLLYCLGIFHSNRDVTIIDGGLHNVGLWSTHMTFEKGVFFILEHPPWHGTSVCTVLFEWLPELVLLVNRQACIYATRLNAKIISPFRSNKISKLIKERTRISVLVLSFDKTSDFCGLCSSRFTTSYFWHGAAVRSCETFSKFWMIYCR